jgi:hypothetical protein
MPRAATHAKEERMRTQNFAKAVLSILVIGTCSAAAVAVGTQAISKGNLRQPAANVMKAGATDVKPAQRVVAD